MQYRKPLSPKFFQKDALLVAPALLGKILIKKTDTDLLSGMIVEVEAYRGEDDEASHAFGGIKNRNKPMFLNGGHIYVYFTYGAHHCLNFVTGTPEQGQAVLIRAVEPLEGQETMLKNRFGSVSRPATNKFITLTNGPGKLCQAFGISRDDNGLAVDEERIFITSGKRIAPDAIGSSTRIGISKDKGKPWRFFLKGNPWVSK